MWRSLFSACEIIRKGSRWRIGDCRRILVTDHGLLPHPPEFLGVVSPLMQVCEMFDRNGQWDKSVINVVVYGEGV